jgi:hypothetical protein
MSKGIADKKIRGAGEEKRESLIEGRSRYSLRTPKVTELPDDT